MTGRYSVSTRVAPISSQRVVRWRNRRWLPAVLLLAGAATATAYGADAATRVQLTSRATLVRPAAGSRQAPVGTTVSLSEVTDIAFANGRVGYALGGPLGSTFPLKTTTEIEAQFPQEFSIAQRSVVVRTQNALWASSVTGWTLLAGTPKPY